MNISKNDFFNLAHSLVREEYCVSDYKKMRRMLKERLLQIVGVDDAKNLSYVQIARMVEAIILLGGKVRKPKINKVKFCLHNMELCHNASCNLKEYFQMMALLD